MKILWDFRLFSTNYKNKGIGVYTKNCAIDLLKRNPSHNIFFLGNINDIPNELLQQNKNKVIPYTIRNWKYDLIKIPWIINKFSFDAIHYWVIAGPIFKIGLGLPFNYKILANLYDLGVEYWTDMPYLEHVRTTRYWKYQKFIMNKIDHIFCDSYATQNELLHFKQKFQKKSSIIYPPYFYKNTKKLIRKKYFITLGGAPNKNLINMLKAFKLFQRHNKSYHMIVLGDLDNDEKEIASHMDNVLMESMKSYETHLNTCSGLIFCSSKEGLGLPPIEAMAHGCPLLLSSIPVLKETSLNSGIFVNEQNIYDIAEGMNILSKNINTYSQKSILGWNKYKYKSKNTMTDFFNFYQNL